MWKAWCMPNKQYPDVAAARHLRDAPREPSGSGDAKRVQASPSWVNAALPVTLRRDKGYRKKRILVSVLSVLVCLSVPALMTLLVVFG